MSASDQNNVPELCALAPQPERGILQAFIEMVDLARPEDASAATMRARVAFHLGQVVGFEPLWQPTAAARLLHLGRVAVASSHDADGAEGELARIAENAAHGELPFFSELGARVLSQVPSLREVALMVAHHRDPASLEDPHLRKGAEIVRSSVDLSRTFSAEGMPAGPQGAPLSSSGPAAADISASDETEVEGQVYEVRAIQLRPNMVTAAAILDCNGKVLLAKGYRITPRIVAHLLQAARNGQVQEPILVHLPEGAGPACMTG